MYKKPVCFLISLILVLPLATSAEALKRYTLPPQNVMSIEQQQAVNPGVSEDVFDRFRQKIKGYSQEEKDRLVDYYRGKIRQARAADNQTAVAYYQRLIGIIKANN